MTTRPRPGPAPLPGTVRLRCDGIGTTARQVLGRGRAGLDALGVHRTTATPPA